jgi:hypothetical protein
LHCLCDLAGRRLVGRGLCQQEGSELSQQRGYGQMRDQPQKQIKQHRQYRQIQIPAHHLEPGRQATNHSQRVSRFPFRSCTHQW